MIPGKQTLRHVQMIRDFQGERTGGEEVRSQGTTGQWRRGCRNRETLGSLGGGDTSYERLLGTKGGPGSRGESSEGMREWRGDKPVPVKGTLGH